MLARMDESQQSSCAVELPAGDAPPAWIQLLPDNDPRARDGRRWCLDNPADVIVASLERAGSTTIPIDYEHQTDLAPTNGQPGPGCRLEVRDGAVWGQVEWTEWAAEHIRQREYSYISPTFLHDKEGRIKLIVRAALTNSPALNMQALAKTEDDFMNQDVIDKILAKLGLKADAATADVEQAPAKLEAQSAQTSDALPQVATALGLDTATTVDKVLAKAKDLVAKGDQAVDPKAYVPRSEFDTAAKQLAKLQQETATAKATARQMATSAIR